MITKLWSSELTNYNVIGQDKESHLNLHRLNLFVGPNNSGKSRLIRSLFASKRENLSITGNLLAEQERINLEKIMPFISHNEDYLVIKGKDIHFIYDINNSFSSINEIDRANSAYERFLSHISAHQPEVGASTPAVNLKRLKIQIKRDNIDIDSLKVSLQTDATNISSRYYIPILRGMRPLTTNSNQDQYSQRTVNDYFSESGIQTEKIITGMHLYSLLVKFLLGEPPQRQRIREYEEALGAAFFGGEKVTLIPQHGKDTVSVKIGSDNQFPIYNLGDGLQQVIIITSAAFLEKQQSLFFIEEPEINLHPGLVKLLAKFLIEHTSHQYIITTHSNHLLEISDFRDDVIIHRVRRDPSQEEPFFLINESTLCKDIFSDLGVNPASVYLANCTIWLEGITDRLYIKAYMERFLERVQPKDRHIENTHYAYVEYQGGTLGHWSFNEIDLEEDDLSAIKACPDMLLIADGDITSKKDRHKKLQEQLGEKLFVLDCKEIENLIPVELLKHTAQKLFAKKRIKKDDLDSKNLDTIEYSDYFRSDNGIGFHLDQKLGLAGKGKDRKFFADESGTISDKVRFCKEIINSMAEIDWNLSPEICSLCERIIAHIKQHNSHY